MNRLQQLLDGKRIAIVGNSPVKKDYSREIDDADVVIRFNHFYNYDSGLVGKRVDIILQTVAQAWYDAYNAGKAHIDVIREQKPNVYLVKRPDHYDTTVHKAYGKGIRVDNGTDWFKPWWRFTTGTCALCYLAQNLTNAEVKVYGFSNEGDEDTWKHYIATDAKHYAEVADEERPFMLRAIHNLQQLKITSKPQPIPKCIVVPIKANSEGAPQKNKKLLLPCLKKITALNYPIYVVGDDYELLHQAKKEYKDKVTCVPIEKIDVHDDITKTLRKWVVETGFIGDVALVQCTSPYMRKEWVDECFDMLNQSSIAATAVPLEFKATSIFREEGGVYIPSSQALPAASVARQLLPSCVRITGAVTAFHTDATQCESIFNIGVMQPVIVDNAVDVDTEEQLKKLKL